MASSDHAVSMPKRRWNMGLIIGFILVLGVLIVAIFGPQLAPRDPMQENVIVQVAPREWATPPFPAFKVPGFPLGSDLFGRDMLSRLLYAVRPTMVMVATVALVRLVLGTLIGVVAGWSSGWLNRFFENLISWALAVPVLMVALCAIAVVGIEWGLPAFIVGFSINGWAETARVVRDQTRNLKGQEFITAAYAMGALDLHIIFRHVMRHILPFVWMLFALEISGTLMVTAGLGFLGYYIGGDVWVTVSDFVARRTSGTPELGQMLSTAWSRLTEPWPLVTTGSTVFLIVLGFNLLGDALRKELQIVTPRPQNALNNAMAATGSFIEERLLLPLFAFLSLPGMRPVLSILLALFLTGGVWWVWQQAAPQLVPIAGADTFEPTQTLQPTLAPGQPTPTPTPLPIIPEPVGALLAEFEASALSGFLGQVRDGTLYVILNTTPPTLVGVSPDGSLVSEREIDVVFNGPPLLGDDGVLYVVDNTGQLTAQTLAGEVLWQVQSPSGRPSATGPIRLEDGTIYYVSGPDMVKVSASGELLWAMPYNNSRISAPLVARVDGGYVFYGRGGQIAETGEQLRLNFPFQADDFQISPDGRVFVRAQHSLTEFVPTSSENPTLLNSYFWNSQGFSPGGIAPIYHGFMDENLAYALYSYGFAFPRSYVAWVWLDDSGSSVTYRTQHPSDMTIGWHTALPDGSVIVCGHGQVSQEAATITCRNIHHSSEFPLWSKVVSDQPGQLAAGRYDPESGRLFLLTEQGRLFVLETEQFAP